MFCDFKIQYSRFLVLVFLFSATAVFANRPIKPRLTKAQHKQELILKELRGSKDLAEYNVAIDHATEIGDYRVADSLVDRARSLLRREEDSLLYFEHLRLKGRLYTILNRYPEALSLFKQSLLFYQSNGRWEKEGEVIVNLVEFYRSAALYDEGREEASYLINHPSFEGLSNHVKAAAYHRLAAICNEHRRNPDSVILLSKKSLSYSEPDSLLDDMGTSYLELGYMFAQNEEDRAIDYFEKAFAVFRKQGRIHYMCNSIMRIASYYMRVQDNRQALTYIDSAMQMAAPYYLPGFTYVALEKKAKLKARLGQFQEAYALRDSAAILYRNAARHRFSENLAIQSRRFRAELSDSRLQVLESEREKTIQRTRSQRILQRAITALLILLVLLLVGLYYFFTRLKRNKDDLEVSEKALHGANQELINTLNEKDGLIEEVHHRVKNNLQLITSLIRVQQFQQKEHMTPESIRMVDDILGRVTAMAVVHEKLYSQQQITQLRAKEYFSELIAELQTLGGQFNQKLKINIEAADVILEVSHGIALGMICTELVANSLKYAFNEVEEPQINIEISKTKEEEGSRVFFSYRDNGGGFKAESKMGMGNRLILLFSRQLEGRHHFETEGKFFFSLEYREE